MKRFLPFIIVAVVALLTFGSGFALYRSKKNAQPVASKEGVAGGIHIRGNKDAPVTIEEFGDFQCPPCGTMSEILHKLGDEYGSRVRLVFHHLPLAVHAHAREAAIAAEAAHEQGKFWEMHDVLYKEQKIWSLGENVPNLFAGYAQSIGLDMARYKKDLADREVAERVEKDQKLAASRDVVSTPTIFLNNVLLPPSQLSPENLHKAIDTALAEKQKEKEKR